MHSDNLFQRAGFAIFIGLAIITSVVLALVADLFGFWVAFSSWLIVLHVVTALIFLAARKGGQRP